MKKYEIEKGIPVPPVQSVQNGKWVNKASKMVKGDCVLLDTQKQATSLQRALKRKGNDSTQRKISGEGFRVWDLGATKTL